MISLLFTFIFKLITKLSDIILAPVISLVTVLIPSFSSFLTYIYQFFDYCFNFLGFVCNSLCIPYACIQAVYLVATATLTITISLRAYQLIVKLYNTFKP